MKILKAIVAAAFAAGLAAPAQATIYDLAANWSDAANPNGVWSYRQGATPLPHVADWFGPLLYTSGTAQPAWAPSANNGSFLPAIFKATSGGADNQSSGGNPPQNWLAGDIITHTTDFANGIGFGPSNVLFTAPTAGVADISGLLWNARIIGDRPQAYLFYIDGVLASSGALVGITRSNAITFGASSVILAAGDTLMLQIYRTGQLGDFVGMGLTVDFTPSQVGAVPELSTWAMMLLGFGGLAFVTTRRRKASAPLAEG